MQVSLVMTIVGRDRPGLVDLVASVVLEHRGNWLESRMCRLGGEFAGILRVEAPRENEQALVNALKALEANALTVVVKADSAAEPAAVQKLAALEVVGQDRPGIVRQISHALAAHGVNVEELLTECLSAPMTGETLFKARARVQIPESCSVSALRQELERIAGDLVVDINFEELPATH